MPDRHTAASLWGRQRERQVLAELLDDVRRQRSRALVLRGEAGIGKTALLDLLAALADGCAVARVAGVESEMELAYAGLHLLCAPLLHRLDQLPAPQRDALEIAFGQRAGRPPDRFLVGLATLGLLADGAEERPLVCLVDDAHWLDAASAQVLAFVARRLLAESVALVFAVREPGAGGELAAIPDLTIGGLDDADARALLEATVPFRLDDGVKDRMIAETGGHPLALLELPRGMTAAELEFGFGLAVTTPMSSRLEEGFVRQLESLPSDTRRLVLIAAAEPLGDVPLLWRAAAAAGLGPEAAAPAEQAGLLSIGVRAQFRHPLVRSAARRAADPHELREAHRALAEATDAALDPERSTCIAPTPRRSPTSGWRPTWSRRRAPSALVAGSPRPLRSWNGRSS